MQQPNPPTVTGASSGTSYINNSSSDTESDQRFKDNLATLSEMFPTYDLVTLRNYLESFYDNPNCMIVIAGMLLDGDCTSGVNCKQNSTRQECGLKRRTDTASFEDDEDQVETSSPYKVKRGSSFSNEAKSSCSTVLRKAEEGSSQANILGSVTRETPSSSRSYSTKKEEPQSSNFNRSKAGSSRALGNFASERTSNADEEDEIVFVKSVENTPKQSFYRTEQSNPGTTSPKQHNGICIRYKGGNLHPSMNKPKKLQIVEINSDRETSTSCDKSPLNRMHESLTDLRCKSSNTRSRAVATATKSKSSNRSPLKSCTRTECSVSKKKATKDPLVENTQECPVSAECEQTEEVIQSNNASGQGASSVTAALSDLEILKKVFPDADSAYINYLLDQHAGEPNRVALVGKELGSNSVANRQNVKKKAVPPVTWFWESESGKLIPFTDSECNALEKELNTCDTQDHSSEACVKAVRLPGSTKHFTVNFGQMMMVCESGQKTPIIRVPGGSDERREIG